MGELVSATSEFYRSSRGGCGAPPANYSHSDSQFPRTQVVTWLERTFIGGCYMARLALHFRKNDERSRMGPTVSMPWEVARA